MARIALARPLETYFVVQESAHLGNRRRFRAVLPYVDAHHCQYRSHEWTAGAGEDARVPDELVRFKEEVERWLDENRMQLVGDEATPILAPIEDGA